MKRKIEEDLKKRHIKQISPVRISNIIGEFIEGFNFLNQQEKTVSFFGSARIKPSHKYYKEAVQLSKKLSERGYTIITGGGPGIMEAGNKGAYLSKGKSYGMDIDLPEEQITNKYVKKSISFKYFFVRKVMLTFAAEAYIFFPGGFGTLDEFFEIITLIQTKKIRKIPIVLLHKSYWEPILNYIEKDLYQKNKFISKEDLKIYYLADSAEEALNYLEKNRIKSGLKNKKDV